MSAATEPRSVTSNIVPPIQNRTQLFDVLPGSLRRYCLHHSTLECRRASRRWALSSGEACRRCRIVRSISSRTISGPIEQRRPRSPCWIRTIPAAASASRLDADRSPAGSHRRPELWRSPKRPRRHAILRPRLSAVPRYRNRDRASGLSASCRAFARQRLISAIRARFGTSGAIWANAASSFSRSAA